MNSLLNYLIEFSLCLTISWAFFKVVLEKLTFFDLNRLFLMGSLGISLIIPLLSFEAITVNETIQEFTLPMVWIGEQLPIKETFWLFELTWQESLIGIYFLGVFFFGLRFILGFSKSFLLLRQSEKYTLDKLTLAVHPGYQPASFFSYILLPTYDPKDLEQQQIILHESVHAQKKHTWDLILVQLAKVILWFNPVIYLFEKSIREVHEFQADSGVTQSFSQIAYSKLLVSLIIRDRGVPCMHHFSQFQTKKRIVMMNSPKSNLAQKRRFLFGIPVFIVMLIAFSCESTDQEKLPVQFESNLEKDGSIIPNNEELEFQKLPNGRVMEIDKVFQVVEEMPTPPGGMAGLTDYLFKNLKYPEQARKLGVEGMVVVKFIVRKDGTLSDLEVEKGIGAGCDAEAVRVLKGTYGWKPGLQRGEKVDVVLRLPINFELDKGKKPEAVGSFRNVKSGFLPTDSGYEFFNSKIQNRIFLVSDKEC